MTQLLKKGYDLYFFQELVEDEVLSFDYQLRKGSLQKRNAIKILEIAGYPATVIHEADELAKDMEEYMAITKLKRE